MQPVRIICELTFWARIKLLFGYRMGVDFYLGEDRMIVGAPKNYIFWERNGSH